jgi:cell division protein FtsB
MTPNLSLVYSRQAKILQSSFTALVKRIDKLKLWQDKLESENRLLRDYIGPPTRDIVEERTVVDGRVG